MRMCYKAEYVYHSVFVGLIYETFFFPQTKAFSNVFGSIFLSVLCVFATKLICRLIITGTQQHSLRRDSFRGKTLIKLANIKRYFRK